MTKEAIAKAPERRVRRTPVGQRQILSVSGKDPNYEYRFVNDTGDRVQDFLDNGWEKVPAKNVRVGDKRVNSPTPEGTDATASVGRGQKAYLLRIKKDWYEEDQAAKQAQVNSTEEAMREQALDGTYGKLELGRDR
jgi:hypothetical protein